VQNAERFNRAHSWEQQKQDYYRLVDYLVAEERH
jgi:hypothetical protein